MRPAPGVRRTPKNCSSVMDGTGETSISSQPIRFRMGRWSRRTTPFSLRRAWASKELVALGIQLAGFAGVLFSIRPFFALVLLGSSPVFPIEPYGKDQINKSTIHTTCDFRREMGSQPEVSLS